MSDKGGVGRQVRTVGAMQVTALGDGHMLAETSIIPAYDEDRARAICDAEGVAFAPGLRLDINGYFIETAGLKLLVDTGSAPGSGPRAGHLTENFTALAFSPEEVDFVVLTHLHGDHIGGLLTRDGGCAFPNAQIVLSLAEHEHAFSPAAHERAEGRARASIERARRTLAPYEGRLRPVAGNGEVCRGVHLWPLPGHTPGHSGVLLESGDERLLIWGDIVHVPLYQAAAPDWGVIFDHDPRQAIETRRAIMAQAADEGLLVAGMHIDFPGFAHVERSNGGYRIRPA